MEAVGEIKKLATTATKCSGTSLAIVLVND